jgi:hypothetical protein
MGIISFSTLLVSSYESFCGIFLWTAAEMINRNNWFELVLKEILDF